MREHKYRGKGECGWSYGSLIYSPKEDQYYIVEHCDEELWFPVDKETVCEFTGLKDKNGKEIFEGDIVRVQMLDNATKHRDFEVKCGEWIDSSADDEKYLGWYLELGEFGKCSLVQEYEGINITTTGEVIGNIHDNTNAAEK